IGSPLSSLSFSPLIFQSESECKDKALFSNFQIFREEIFQKTFSELVAVSRVSLSKRLQR
ncbi:hypothetical protein, partial [Alistipes putredinis]|uniref:hypothetical protein n=1 Tax=Alistipes putredinis TaxID=28117 RepID=UPI003A85854A